MQSKEYWEKRAEQNILTSEKNAHEMAMKVQRTYKQAMKDIEDEINRFYARFGRQQELTLAEVKKLLNPKELKAFREQAKLYYDEAYANNWETAYTKHMRILSPRAYMSRLEELKINIYHQLQRIYQNELREFTDGLEIQYNESFYHTVYDYQKGIGYGASFSAPNPIAIQKAINKKWYSDNYSGRIWKDRNKLIQTLDEEIPRAFALGENPRETARRLRNIIEPKFAERTRTITVDDKKQKRTLTSQCERLARTEFNQIANEASLDGIEELNRSMNLGIEKYQFLATLDSRTSEICADLDSKKFPIKEKQVGVNFPPMHPNCYDKETEVYTTNGWKLFKDCKNGELFLSMNPETEEIEFLPALKKIEYSHNGEMISFTSKTFDLLVTPDHQMISKYAKKDGNGKLVFKNAEDMPKYSNVIPRGCKWEGVNTTYAYIGKYKVDIEIYLKFMAWYLSDGSTTKTKNLNSYRMKLSQKTHLELMWEELQKLPFKITKTDEAINCYDYSVGEYLHGFGKCNEKFVPDIIKKLSPDLIKIFLNAYAIADGTIKKGKKWKGSQFEDSISFFTSSDKLASDLGELILKSGGRPSYRIKKSKGVAVKHHNGTYIGNYDVWIINWCNRVWSYTDTINKEKIMYNNMVYCVELPKWHTLYVRRNGKCCWCGNCRSTYTIVFDDEEITERIAKDKSGKYYYVPSNMNYKEWKEKYGE